MRKTLVSLCVGNTYVGQLNKVLPGWKNWCAAHNYDLILFDEPLDSSPLANSRSFAWQKLLAMSSPKLKGYDQALWLDTDILINPRAPDPLFDSDSTRVLISRDMASPLSAEPVWLKSLWSDILHFSLLRSQPNNPFLLNPTSKNLFSYYDLWGFSARNRILYNTGVVGFSPLHHASIFEQVYYRWYDGGSGALHEMIPLNLELFQRGLITEIDSKFNYLAGVIHAAWNSEPLLLQEWLNLGPQSLTANMFINHLFNTSYFLHFAGAHKLMNDFNPYEI